MCLLMAHRRDVTSTPMASGQLGLVPMHHCLHPRTALPVPTDWDSTVSMYWNSWPGPHMLLYSSPLLMNVSSSWGKTKRKKHLLRTLTFTISSTQPFTRWPGGLSSTALPGMVSLLSGGVTGHKVFSHLQKNRFAWQCPEGVLYCHNLMLTLSKSAALSVPPCALASPVCLRAKNLGPGMYLLTLFF